MNFIINLEYRNLELLRAISKASEIMNLHLKQEHKYIDILIKQRNKKILINNISLLFFIISFILNFLNLSRGYPVIMFINSVTIYIINFDQVYDMNNIRKTKELARLFKEYKILTDFNNDSRKRGDNIRKTKELARLFKEYKILTDFNNDSRKRGDNFQKQKLQ